MRFEQFEIQVSDEESCVYISQDATHGEREDIIKLSLHQVPMFIAAMQKAVAGVEKAD